MRGTPHTIALVAVVVAGLGCSLPKKSGPATDDDVSPGRAKAFSKYELIASPKGAKTDPTSATAPGEISRAATLDTLCGSRRAFEAKLLITATLALNLDVARTISGAEGTSDADLKKTFGLIGPKDGKIPLSNQIELWCEEGSSELKGKFEDKGKWYPIDPASTARAEPDGRVQLDLVLRRPTTAEEIVQKDLRNPTADTLFDKRVSFVRLIEHRVVLVQTGSPATGRAEATYEGSPDLSKTLPKGILSGESVVQIKTLSGTGGAPKTDPPRPSAQSKPKSSGISEARGPGRSVPRRLAARTGTLPAAPTAWDGKSWVLDHWHPTWFDSPPKISWLDLDNRCSGKWLTRFPADAAMKFENADIQKRIDEKSSNLPEPLNTHRFFFLYVALCFNFDGRVEPFGAFCTTENNPALCTGESHEKDANWSPLLLARIIAKGGNKDEFLLAVEAATQRDQKISAAVRKFFDFGPDYADRNTARQQLRIAGTLKTARTPGADGYFPARYEGSLIVEPFQETADLLQKRTGIHDARLLPKKTEPGWMVSP